MRGYPCLRISNSLTLVLKNWSKPAGSAAYYCPTVGLVHCVQSFVATTFKQGFCHSSSPRASTDADSVTPKVGLSGGPVAGGGRVENDNVDGAGRSSSQPQSKYPGMHKVASVIAEVTQATQHTTGDNAEVTQATQHTTNNKLWEPNTSAVLSYLADQGFTAAELTALHKKYPGVTKLDVDVRVKPVLEYFQEMGLSRSQIVKLVGKRPQVLSHSVNSKLQPLVEWLLEHHGVERSKLGSILLKKPGMFGLSIENKLQRTIQWLLHHGVDRSKTRRVLEKFPQLFSYSIEKNLQPTVEWLVHHGVDRSKIGSILQKFPQLFGLSVGSNLQPAVEWLVHHGVDRSKIGSILEKFPHLFSLGVESNLQPTVEWLVHHGVDRSKIASILEKFPQLFGFSVESNLQATLDHLVCLGLRPENIPKVLQSSTIVGLAIDNINAKCDVLRYKYKLPEDFIQNMLNTRPQILRYDLLANFNSYLGAGLTKDEIKSMVMKDKMALERNINKRTHKPKLQFYLEVAHYKIQDIAECPRLLGSSLETIKARREFAIQQGSVRHPTPKEFRNMLC